MNKQNKGTVNLDRSINKHNIGAKVKLLDENFGDTVWVPALAVECGRAAAEERRAGR